VRDMLKPVKEKNPNLSIADIWIFAGCSAVEFCGGPRVPVHFGRNDASSGSYCPPNGRLPDASQGAQHLRDVFYRMGFDDRAIVCLSGAHTLGRCHLARSGFDGPWTRHPLRFDNDYFKNLIELKWTKREWDGPEQYEDPSGDLMMLSTDVCLIHDDKFRPFVEMYAKDQELFFKDFAQDFNKLTSLGTTCPAAPTLSTQQQAGVEFREAAMHGSLPVVKKLASSVDVNEVEAHSGRTALHKAAFWGHEATVDFLLTTCKINAHAQDYNGDTALHDAARFGHKKTLEHLLPHSNKATKNKEGKTAADVAKQYGQEDILALLG